MWVNIWYRLQLLKRERGQDLAEYAMLIALIALIVVVAVSALGEQISDTFYARFAAQITNAIEGR